jgi:hypothetical protein
LIERNDLEKVLGAGRDAVTARRTLRDVDDWKAEPVHRDRVECARDSAIAKPQAAPRAPFATAGDRRGRAARREPAILGPLHGDVGSSGAQQPGHALVRLTRVHTEIARDRRGSAFVDHVAPGGLLLARHHLLGEAAAARKAARSAVRSRQHRRHDVDARILVYAQLPGSERDERREHQPDAGENLDRENHRVQHLSALMTTILPTR